MTTFARIILHILLTSFFTRRSFGNENCNPQGRCLPPGIDISDGSCNDTEVQNLAAASEFVNAFLNAAQYDLNNKDKGLYNALFLPTEKRIVLRGLNNLQSIARGQSATWALSCQDTLNRCNEAIYAYYMSTFANTKTIPPISNIVFCPLFFALPATFDPCDKSSLTSYADQVTIMIHEILHTEYMTGPYLQTLLDYFKWADVGKALNLRRKAFKPMFLMKGVEPWKSVSNWQWYVRYAWIQNQQIVKCPENFPLWKAFSSGDTTSDFNELRQLLYADDINSTSDGLADVFDCNGTCSEIEPSDYTPLANISISDCHNDTGICPTLSISAVASTSGSNDTD